MQLITRLENAFAWILCKGSYQQAPLYARNKQVFAKYGAGYIRLSAQGSTSKADVRWLEIDPGDVALLDLPQNREPVFLGFRPEVPAIAAAA